MIAAFWGDVDNRDAGTIFYTETTRASYLTTATVLIKSAFNNNFGAASLMVATWDNVGNYMRHCDEVRTCMALCTINN